ncbi:MAG: hypothetical protein KAI47_13605, partial [Deltaproteobacteria bacterium]|nr:hypothetical protein [Deltaproteobacteria bacterium]
TNTDIWWHLAAGRLIVKTGHFLYEDPFSSGAFHAPWIDVHWLFQVLAYGVYRLGGVEALVWAKALVVGLAAWSLLLVSEKASAVQDHSAQAPSARHTLPHATRPWAILIIVTLVTLTRSLIFARPIVLTLLFLSLFLLILESFRTRRHPRILLLLLPLQILWANTQGLFLLGPLLVAIYALGDLVSWLLFPFVGFSRFIGHTRKEASAPRSLPIFFLLFLSILGLIAASLLTPYGLRGLFLPFVLLQRIDPTGALYALNVSENIPPWEIMHSGSIVITSFPWVSAAIFASFLPALRRLVPARLGVAAAFFFLALMANRNILLFYWVAGAIVPMNLAPLFARLHHGIALSPRRLLAMAAIAISGLSLLTWQNARESKDEGAIDTCAPFRVPTQGLPHLTSLLRHLPPQAPRGIFNSIRYGGYLAFSLFPHAKPFIDGRLVIRSPAAFSDYLDIVDRPERAFDVFAKKHAIAFALLPTVYPKRYLRLVVYLYHHPKWDLVYTDGTETLFWHRPDGSPSSPAIPPPRSLPTTSNPPFPGAIDLGSDRYVSAIIAALAHRYKKAAHRDRAMIHFGALLTEVGERQRARDLLRTIPSRGAQTLLARLAFLDGDHPRAKSLSKALLTKNPKDAESLFLLAKVAAS